MSQERPQNQDQLKCVSRRSRKDQQGRDFVCGCGKKYLSYPALYTHIKTKHQGNQPQGTQKTGTTTTMRRNKQKIDEKLLRQIYKFMNEENIKILNYLNQNAFGNVPLNHRIRRQSPCKQIFQAFLNINKKQSNLVLNKQSSLQTVLAIYLLNVGQYISQSLYHYYMIFARQFRACYYEHGQQIFQNCFKGNGQNKINIFTTQQCCYVPLIADFFIRYYITLEHKDINLQSLMQLLTYDFCFWMFQKKLTNIQVILNKQYKILNKQIILPKFSQKKITKIDENRRQYSNDIQSNQCSEEQSQNKNQKDYQQQGMQIEKSQRQRNYKQIGEEIQMESINEKNQEQQKKNNN